MSVAPNRGRLWTGARHPQGPDATRPHAPARSASRVHILYAIYPDNGAMETHPCA